MLKGSLRLTLPNPHRGDISSTLLGRLLRQAGIAAELGRNLDSRIIGLQLHLQSDGASGCRRRIKVVDVVETLLQFFLEGVDDATGGATEDGLGGVARAPPPEQAVKAPDSSRNAKADCFMQITVRGGRRMCRPNPIGEDLQYVRH